MYSILKVILFSIGLGTELADVFTLAVNREFLIHQLEHKLQMPNKINQVEN